MDDFRRRMAMRRKVHFVLHRGEKLLGRIRIRLVIHAGRVNIQHLLVEPPFRWADVADTRQQFVEIIRLPLARRIFQPFVIHREALDDVFIQPLRRPNAKLRATRRFHAVANGNDGVQIVMF